MMKRITLFLVIAAIIASVTPCFARTKLVALPERGAVTIRLDNPDATLIQEERILTLHEGVNRVDFSWSGVSLDVDSIRIEPVTHPGEVVLLNVSYPPQEAALVWEISSKGAWEETVRISYLLSGIDRLIDYRFNANVQETNVGINSYLILRNFSGEDFDRAGVLLDYGDRFEESVKHEETKKLLFFKTSEVPVEKTWTFDASELPWDPEEVHGNVGIPVSYKIKNDKKSGLGTHALWGGKVRVFQNDGHGGDIVLGEDYSDLVPLNEEMKVSIGDSRDIVVTQRKMSERNINVRKNNKNRVVLYDTDEVIKAVVENFKDQPATLTMNQYIPGQWEMKECNYKFEKEDSNKLVFNIKLGAGEKKELIMHYQRRNIRP